MKKTLCTFVALAVGVSMAHAIFPDKRDSTIPSVVRLVVFQNGAWQNAGSGVAISSTWVLTASHTGGTHIETAPGRRIPIQQRIAHTVTSGNPADLALLKLGGSVASTSRIFYGAYTGTGGLKNRTCRLVGYGLTGTSNSTGWRLIDNTWGVRRAAQNVIDDLRTVSVNVGSSTTPRIKTGQYLIFDLDRPGSSARGSLGGSAVTDEGGIAAMDSGGGMFVQQSGSWQLVAINAMTGTMPGIPTAYHYGGIGFSVYLTPYRDWIARISGVR